MATREKTVVFAFPMTTSDVADAVTTNLSQITVYIPEASPVFKSVFVEIGWQDIITATGGTITEHRCGLRLGAAAYTTITETDDIANTGENMAGVVGPFDFTTHFTTNWTGTSMTCDVQVYFDQTTGTTLGMRNVTAMLYVTYQYDDTVATQIKTVRLPFDSTVAGLPTTNGTPAGTVPQLTGVGGILPESNIVIRDYFFVIEGNEVTTATTDFTLSCSIDQGTATVFGTQEAALASDRFCRWIYRPSVPDTSTTHTMEIWSSLANRAHHITVTLVITYEFDLAGTSRVLNSIAVPVEIASPLGLSVEANSSRFQRDIFISEPGTITLRMSGFRMNFNIPSSVTAHRWRAGSQVFRSYTSVAGQVCGMFSVQQRIDSGAAQGAGITIARGKNTITIDGYTTSIAAEMTNINGYIIMNYESDLASEGIGAHAHSVFKILLPWNAALSDLNRITSYSFSIPESQYWIIAAGFCFIQWASATTMAVTFDVQCLSGESKEAGYIDIYADAYTSDAERACSIIWMRGRDTFKRCPDDADTNRLDIETSRDYRLYTTVITGNGLLTMLTYNSLTWEITGNISGAAGSGDITLRLIRVSDKEVIKQQVVAANTTSYTFVTHDNTENYMVIASQAGSNTAVSAEGTGV